VRIWIGFVWLRILTSVAGSCEHGNEPLSFITGGEFEIHCLSQLLLASQ
jgi:hypothetical protein